MEGIEIRLPEISGSQEERLQKLQSYLFQLAGQLQFAFDSVNRQMEAVPAAPKQTTPAETFGAIKSLIVKSADVVSAVSDKVQRQLDGQYVAQSEFGTYCRDTQQQITETAENIQQTFRNLQRMESHITGIENAMLETNAYIRTGLLFSEESGREIYGVEIGQQDYANGVMRFRKFARLTADKLSFYDSNDMEVAYISDYRLHVTGAVIHNLTTEETAAQKLHFGEYVWAVGRDGHLTLS